MIIHLEHNFCYKNELIFSLYILQRLHRIRSHYIYSPRSPISNQVNTFTQPVIVDLVTLPARVKVTPIGTKAAPIFIRTAMDTRIAQAKVDTITTATYTHLTLLAQAVRIIPTVTDPCCLVDHLQ